MYWSVVFDSFLGSSWSSGYIEEFNMGSGIVIVVCSSDISLLSRSNVRIWNDTDSSAHNNADSSLLLFRRRQLLIFIYSIIFTRQLSHFIIIYKINAEKQTSIA